MPKAVLIAPFSEAMFQSISLGSGYLGAVMERNGWEVKIVTPRTEYRTMSIGELKDEIEKFSPEFIGMTLYTENIRSMYNYIAELRSLYIPLIAGGPHPSVLPHEVLNNGVDIVVRGEGEETLIDLMEYFSGEKNKNDILGISYKDEEGNIVDIPDRPPIKDLNSIPLPAKHLYENESNIRHENDYGKFNIIIASRGCPFKCTYCNHKNFFRYRYRSPENIIEEINFLKSRYGLSSFSFEDSAFTINRKHTVEFCDAIIVGKINIKWCCSTRLDLVDYELLAKMKEAGCTLIVYGVESLNPDTLKRIRKSINPERLDKVANWMKDVDIMMNANFMWGFPWEKAEDIRGNLEEVKNRSIYFDKIMAAGIPMPFPGTELYDNYKNEYGFDNWWLNPKKKYNYNPYLYQSFLYGFQTSLINNSFFNYSPQIRKELNKVAKFIVNFNRKDLSFKRRVFVRILVVISKILSRISSWGEVNLFQRVLFDLRYRLQRPLF